MVIIISDLTSKIVPWKNGGGETCELYKIPHPTNPQDFVFRISMATVSQSGPFSVYEKIDRTLVLLEGEGMKLQFKDRSLNLDKKLAPIYFKGEELIECELLNGACTDFNIMIDRNWGNCTLEINTQSLETAQNIVSSDLVFISRKIFPSATPHLSC